MEEAKRAALDACLPELINDLDVVSVAVKLTACGVLTEDDFGRIDRETTSNEKRLKLLTILPTKDYWWQHFLNTLNDVNQKNLIEKLQAALQQNQLWQVPPRNPYFTGREKHLDQLGTCLAPTEQSSMEEGSTSTSHQKQYTVISACHGLGGVGKTQIAIEFIHRHQDKYPYVFWFPAEMSTQIEIAYQKLAQTLKMDTKDKPTDEIVSEIKTWFQRHPGCLLVYDNAESAETIENYLPSTGSHVLVTSRNTDWDSESFPTNELIVDVFEPDEAREYVKKRLDDRWDMAQVDTLTKTLGYLPLALAQATAYIKTNKVAIKRYLQLYEEHKAKHLAHRPKSKHEPVFVTWDITIEAIEKKSRLAVHLLNVCAYFNSDNIPHFLLRPLAESQEKNPDKETFEEALAISANYSMLTIDPERETASMHQLVQQVIRLKAPPNPEPLTLARDLALKTFPYEGDSLEDYQKKASLIPHMETVLCHVEQGFVKEESDDKSFLTDFLERIAEGYRVIGRHCSKGFSCITGSLISTRNKVVFFAKHMHPIKLLTMQKTIALNFKELNAFGINYHNCSLF